MIGKLLLSVWILRWIGLFGEPAVAQVWPTSLDESLDERNDAEIFRAVVESMRQWALHKKSHHRTKREVSRVCYEDVGCFEDTGPFSYLEMLPSPPKDVGTRFLVYGSRKARSIPMEVPAEDINDSAHRAIDPDLPTKVIVHGFGSSCDHVWVYEMRSALMTVHECNIVCVDWGPGSAVPNYVRAAANTRLVGRQLAKLIRSLEVPLEKVHLIGFSLGAHVAGFAGAELGNVSRITGLDPAGPLFESQDPRARLDQTDANFVDVIHSNGEQLILGGLGSWQPMGDVDFYPNGGRMQTGCSNLFLGAVSDIIWSSSVEGRSLCNHRRAYKLFTDSVSPKCRFPAFPCDHGYDGLLKGDCFPCSINNIERPCGDMGYYSDESPARGQLYLVTREEEPFCAHQYQARVYNSRGERPTRSYGKLQVTVIGEGGFNESFAMTRKDEELLVGVVLQKIVVPHPAINNIEAIEIKYTAYSGWISSGLVSWSIDKVAIVNSFGNVLSICKKGLILESGLPVHLPLYPGECNVPLEADNSTNPMVPFERLTQENQGGSIGPFTKEQNYENNESHSAETFQGSRLVSQRKSLGPFTKEQNLRVIEENDTFKSPDDYKNSENRRGSTNPWTIVDISSDGDSNSLELQESEKGRSFSGSNFIQREPPTADSSVEATTQFLPEIQEPVLQLNKKEAGRSLKLPEITEPILRPRSARQNARQDACQDKRQDEIQETSSSSSRGFTVQFLPERLAGILAQAERYARQTLLPLISQYTPSFVGGSRNEEPKYFPLWGDASREESANESVQLVSMTTPNVRVLGADSSERAPNATTSRGKSLAQDKGTFDNGEINVPTEAVDGIASDGRSNVAISKDHPIIIYPEKQQVKQSAIVNDSDRRDFLSSHDNRDRWTPMNEHTTTVGNIPFQRGSNVSRSLDWLEESLDNSTQKVDLARPGTNDWIPITESDDRTTPTALQGLKEDVTVQTEAPAKDDATRQDSARSTTVESVVDGIDESKIRSKDERKFIPLMDFKDPSGFLASTKANDVAESRADVITFSTHIQRIPGPTARTTETKDRKAVARTMIFPYAYERRKDPRTRYIPLIPEEDIGRTRSSFEKDR